MWWCFNFSIAVFLLGCLQISESQIATHVVALKDLLKMQKGLGWPRVMLVAEGHEALMKLTAVLADQQSCTVTTPAGVTFTVTSPPSNRYEQWSDGCGLRVRQVVESDTGRWRLTATNATGSVTGWIEVNVNEDTRSYAAPPIALQDGETQANVDLTSLDNSYCLVTQPFSESALVPGHCRVNLERATRAVQGNWDILIGLPGQVSELHIQRQVAVEDERLETGYIHDSNLNKIHLYCNILHTTKNITFCRFQKTTNTVGYNLMEGLSDGYHSYYGKGFVDKNCGMTIEHPSDQDYGTWRCSVGSQQWVDNTVQEQTPLQALINVIANPRSLRTQRTLRSDVEENRTVFVQEDLSFTVTCRAEVSLSYCWFLHPNGSQYSPVPQADDATNQLFWYTGHSLQTGDCGITFSHANISDAGDWVCHMGVRNQLGLEYTERISVRVTGPLAANRKDLNVVIGHNATLHCHTSNGNRPLDYCRFLTPDYVGIHIDASVSQENAILGRYFFGPGHSLDYGDCSLVINSVQAEDVGTWGCAARINGDTTESSDTMELHLVDGEVARTPLSRAGIAGMSVGAIFLVLVLAGVVWHKLGRPVPWNRNGSIPDSIGVVPFDLMSVNTQSLSRTSAGGVSDGSGDNVSNSSEEMNVGPLEVSRYQVQGPQGEPSATISRVRN